MKTPNKRGLQKTALNHSSDIDLKDFVNICKKYTAEKIYFLNQYVITYDNWWSD